MNFCFGGFGLRDCFCFSRTAMEGPSGKIGEETGFLCLLLRKDWDLSFVLRAQGFWAPTPDGLRFTSTVQVKSKHQTR